MRTSPQQNAGHGTSGPGYGRIRPRDDSESAGSRSLLAGPPAKSAFAPTARMRALAVGLLVYALIQAAPGTAQTLAEAKPTPARQTLCVHDVPSGQFLAVHRRAEVGAPVVARLAHDTCDITVAGACSGRWCLMRHGQNTGWIDTRYIGVYEYPAERPADGQLATAGAATKPGPERAASPSPPKPQPGAAPPSRHDATGREPNGRAGACVVGVEEGDTLRVRQGPGVGHEAVGEIPRRACNVKLIGNCRGAWCRVAWRGQTGWVNTDYLE